MRMKTKNDTKGFRNYNINTVVVMSLKTTFSGHLFNEI